jgi:hypothetical protein
LRRNRIVINTHIDLRRTALNTRFTKNGGPRVGRAIADCKYSGWQATITALDAISDPHDHFIYHQTQIVVPLLN